MKPLSHHAPPEIMPGPEAEVTADFEIVGDVVADDPQRDHDLRAADPERPALLAINQGLEDLATVGLAVLGAQHHPVRPGAELRARVAVIVREGRHQGLVFEPLHARHHLRSINIVTRYAPALKVPGGQSAGAGTTTVPVAVTTTIGSASTVAAESPRAGSARHTTWASNRSWRLRRPTAVTVAVTSMTSPARTGARNCTSEYDASKP